MLFFLLKTLLFSLWRVNKEVGISHSCLLSGCGALKQWSEVMLLYMASGYYN